MHRLDQLNGYIPANLFDSRSLTLEVSDQTDWPVHKCFTGGIRGFRDQDFQSVGSLLRVRRSAFSQILTFSGRPSASMTVLQLLRAKKKRSLPLFVDYLKKLFNCDVVEKLIE